MITNEQRQLIHQFVVIDMAQRSIKSDIELYEKYTDRLKMTKIYMKIINELAESIHQEYHNIKRLLNLNKIQVGRWQRVDDTHSNYYYIYQGIEDALMYNNLQLKNEVENMLIQRLTG
ncbi:hypothetical protein [Solibacillus sp. CAU 1738]|uniref:hypothetical protein n=1 Tax=Solibacillus sp. CAU 1738 TaxID=3140363 RepID=UPI003260B91B